LGVDVLIGTVYQTSTDLALVEFNTFAIVRAYAKSDRKDKSDNFMTFRHYCPIFPSLHPLLRSNPGTDSTFTILQNPYESGSATLPADLMGPVDLSRQIQSLGLVINSGEEMIFLGTQAKSTMLFLALEARKEKKREARAQRILEEAKRK